MAMTPETKNYKNPAVKENILGASRYEKECLEPLSLTNESSVYAPQCKNTNEEQSQNVSTDEIGSEVQVVMRQKPPVLNIVKTDSLDSELAGSSVDNEGQSGLHHVTNSGHPLLEKRCSRELADACDCDDCFLGITDQQVVLKTSLRGSVRSVRLN